MAARASRTLLLLAVLPAVGCAAPRVGRAPSEGSAAATRRGLDVLAYDIHLDLAPEDRGFDGREEVAFRALESLDLVVLDAVELDIRSVERLREPGGPGRPVSGWRHDGRRLRIPLDPPLRPGQEGRLRLAWRARPRFGMYFVLPEDKGFDHPPQVYTQGECLGTRWWLPCNDHPADRARYSLSATVPASWITVSGGAFQGREAAPDGLRATESWSMEQPVPTYLFTFFAGPFVRAEDLWAGRPVQYVLEPGDLERGRAALAATPDVLEFFSSWTGFDYPFPKYATVAVRDFPFGGMENASATTIGRDRLPPAAQALRRPAWGLVAHEAAHQWFGDTVTCADWPHVWLNEGFASFFTQLYRRHREGDEAFRLAMGRLVDSYTRACRGDGLRALVEYRYEHPFDLFFSGGAAYAGGATRVNLLRGWVGEAAFRDLIHEWLQENAFRSVTTADLEALVRRRFGEALSTFFPQWVESPGYPELQVAWEDDGQGTLRLEVRQVQDSSTGIPQVFHMPLDVRWLDAGGWHEERAWIREREEAFTWPAAFPVRLVELDPEVYLPARMTVDEPVSATLARLAEGRSARSRVLALRRLARLEASEVARAALWRAAEEDPVSGVRAEAVRVLAERAGAVDMARAAAAWRREESPEVRRAWLRLLTRQAGEAEAAGILEAVLADEEADPALRATALQGLAGERPAAGLRSWLQGFVEASLPEGGPLLEAALAELAARFPDGETRSLLVELAGRGHPTPVRRAALVRLGPWLQTARAASDPAVVAVRKALASASVPLRRTAAGLVGQAPRWFEEEVARLRREEPDRGVVRALPGPGR